MSAANVAHHHVSPHPSGNRGEGGVTKVKTVVKPMSINPTKNVELVLEPVREFKDTTVVVVVSEKFQATYTVCRPLGTTDIDPRDGYIVSPSVDLAYVNLENPGKQAADKQFEKVAIEEYVKLGLFAELNGHIYYVDKTDSGSLVYKDRTREDHILHAKKDRDAAVKVAKKEHAAAEIQAGRTGQMRPNGLGKAPKPREFDATKINWMTYLGEVQPLEQAFLDFKKTSKVLETARAGRKAYLSQFSTKIGSSNSVEQKEARALKGTSANLAPSKIAKIIQDALSNVSYSDEDDEIGEPSRYINSGGDKVKESILGPIAGEEGKIPPKPKGAIQQGGSPAASGAKIPGKPSINPASVGTLINELGALVGEGNVATFSGMNQFVNAVEDSLNAQRTKTATGLHDPVVHFQFSAQELKQIDAQREQKYAHWPTAVKQYFSMRTKSTDRAALQKKYDTMTPEEKLLSKEVLIEENNILLLFSALKPK